MEPCLAHLRDLLSIVAGASRQDLFRIAGYLSWLAWTMGWPQFIASHIRDRSTYWARTLLQKGALRQPRRLKPALQGLVLHTDATPTSLAAVIPGTPPSQLYCQYDDTTPIAFAEMAAALAGLLWATKHLDQPRNITLYTDSSIVFYSLSRGTGLTLRRDPLLKNLYIRVTWLVNKENSGHGLVVRWLPSEENLADPLSRGVLS
jgi:ribonuclease HI